MKNLFKILIPVFAILAIFSISSFDFLKSEKSSNQNSIEQKKVLQHLAGVDHVNTIVSDISFLDTTAAGLCDTCYTGYIQAITENRILANRLSDQNFELSEASKRTSKLVKAINKENDHYAAILKRKQKARSILEYKGLSLGQ